MAADATSKRSVSFAVANEPLSGRKTAGMEDQRQKLKHQVRFVPRFLFAAFLSYQILSVTSLGPTMASLFMRLLTPSCAVCAILIINMFEWWRRRHAARVAFVFPPDDNCLRLMPLPLLLLKKAASMTAESFAAASDHSNGTSIWTAVYGTSAILEQRQSLLRIVFESIFWLRHGTKCSRALFEGSKLVSHLAHTDGGIEHIMRTRCLHAIHAAPGSSPCVPTLVSCAGWLSCLGNTWCKEDEFIWDAALWPLARTPSFRRRTAPKIIPG